MKEATEQTGLGPSLEQKTEEFRECYTLLQEEIGRVFIGQPATVELLLIALFCGGHVLLEGVPGVGKTLLVKTLSSILHLKFSRIQCTPDLMPADIIGTNVMVDDTLGGQSLRFERGPLFANVVLADEINRATPKTQSAFLEAMQERRITVFGVNHILEGPFLVLATQNPIEMEGTYPLPEAQLDRFFFKLQVGYPSLDDLSRIMDLTTSEESPIVEARYGWDDVIGMMSLVKKVKIAEDVKRFALRLTLATHPDSAEAVETVRKYVRYGASPRAGQAMVLAGKARALAEGRYNVSVDDIRACALAALNHRIIFNFEGEVQQISANQVVDELLKTLVGRSPS